MKTTIKNTLIGFFTFLAIITLNVANATVTEEISPAAELKVVAHLDNQPVFQLSLHNAQNAQFIVVLLFTRKP